MAHNLNIKNGKASMAYYGEEPWHGLGTRIPQRATSKQMIEVAGMDWRVEKRTARGVNVDKDGKASRYEIMRLPRQNKNEDEVLLGIVTNRYEPLQNIEAFNFFDPIIKDNKACFETAGALGDGERVWVLAKMPDEIKVATGDSCYKYLLLSNTHNGEGSVTVKFTAIRVVCQNTLILAINDHQKAFKVRHTKNMALRMNNVAEMMALEVQTFETAGKLFKRFASIHLNSGQFTDYLDKVYPRTPTQKQKSEVPQRWDYVTEIFEKQDDLQLSSIRRTLWAAYNAIARFEDYKTVQNETQSDQRLGRVWFGSSADLKLRALTSAKNFADTIK